MQDQSINKIKELIKNLLTIMGFKSAAVEPTIDEEGIVFGIKTDEANLLIGQGGNHLFAFQQIVRLLVLKDQVDSIKFIIDVNDYRKHRIKFLKEMVLNYAKKSIMENRSIILDPMNAYERRLVHLILGDISGISTESTGEGKERRVVIRPI